MSLADLLPTEAQPSRMPQSPQSTFALIQKLIGMGVPQQMVPLIVQKLLSQGVSESALPHRGMLNSTNPAMPNTTIPNAYRGPLQPPGALPAQSPSAYPDWQWRI